MFAWIRGFVLCRAAAGDDSKVFWQFAEKKIDKFFR